MSYTFETGVVTMRKIAYFAFLCAVFIGCYDYTYVDDYYDVAVSGMMEHRKLSGKLDFPKSFKVSSLKAFELDTNWNQVEELEAVLDSGDSSYHIDYRDYSNQLVQLIVSGTWKNFDSVGVSVTFEKIEDITTISTKYRIDLDLFDYLEIPRVEKLMEDGYPIEIAKEKSEQEIMSIYAKGLSQDEDIKSFAYTLFSIGDSDSGFVENIENFRNDFVDGSWMDYRDRIKTADYLTQNWQSFSSDDLRYYGQVQMGSYGIPIDSHSGETFVIEDSTSAFYKDSLVCAGYGRARWRRDDGGYDTYAHNILRPFTDLEREIGACVFDSLKWGDKDTTVVEFEGETYKCSHQLDSSVPTKPDFENWKKVKSRK